MPYEDDQPTEIVASNNSLSSRMGQRAEQLSKRTTECFGIPGWDDLLQVELRALGYQAIRRIQQRHEQKVRDEALREVYTMADQILAATVGFHEVLPSGKTRALPGETWVTLAKRLPDCPAEPTGRQALLFLVSEERIAFLVQEWGVWVKASRQDIDEEVVADFATTG